VEGFLLDRLNILIISYAKRNTPAEATIVTQSLRVTGANPINLFIEGYKWLPGEVNDYWRDVGTIDSYWEANMDLRSVTPKFDLCNKYWPIYAGRIPAPPAKFVHNEQGRRGHSLNSTISEGCIISGSTVVDSVLGPFVHIHSYSEAYQSILMEDIEVGRGSRIQNAIIDKHVVIPPETHIGFGLEEDSKKYYVSPRGVVVIPKGSKYDRPPYV
jgi:glucose-1-phosphate adenylyltransferase